MKSKLKRILTWGFLLTKRIYKKPAFLIILILIPLVAFSLSLIVKEDSGFVTIAICDESKGDELNTEIIKNITEDSSLIRFINVESSERGRELVLMGKADALWIFPDDLKEAVDKFTDKPIKQNAFMEIFQKEETMFLKVSREKLTGAFFQSLSKSSYISYLRSTTPELSHLSDEELLRHYFDASSVTNLFNFEDLDSPNSATQEEQSYLIAPLRGLMAVLTVLSGLATSLFFMKDKTSGLFSWVPIKLHAAVEFSYQLISVVSISLAVSASLLIAGVYEGFLRETLSIIVLALSTSTFCMLVRILSKKLRTLSILLPLLVIIMITMCPVFFSFKVARLLKFLFPPTYYLSSISSPVYLLYGLIYVLVTAVIYGIIKYKKET